MSKRKRDKFGIKPQPKNERLNAFEPKTFEQADYLQEIEDNEILFAHGVAGSGKTYAAVAYGLKMILEKVYDRLIITRPAVEAGERHGFLPGNQQAKMQPYLEPIMDVLREFITDSEIANLINMGKIQIAPLAYIRGRTFKNSIIIVDEAQNCSEKQMKLIITRIGDGSKLIINGDYTQSDIGGEEDNALKLHIDKFIDADCESIYAFEFSGEEIIRNPIIKEYLRVMGEN